MSGLKETVKNHRLVRHLYYFARGVVQNKQLSAKARKTLKIFQSTCLDPAQEARLVKDMVRMNAYYGFDFDEYLCYRFAERDMDDRRTFVADWEHLGYTCAMNNAANAGIYDNKWNTYQKYQRFYGRDILLCCSIADAPAFQAFTQKHTRFITKPLDASCGKGIQIFDREKFDGSDEAFFEMLLHTYQSSFVVEELIVQVTELEKLHPASVNTVRVPTIRTDDETLIIHPFLRIGQHGNHVDNAGAGGIMAAVDVETGRVFAAADEYGKVFDVHPDTNEQIVGYVIPRWEEAKKLVKELAQVVPDNRYTGWDIALTDHGWIMVEANRRGQFVWQIPMQKGFREEINCILSKLGKTY